MKRSSPARLATNVSMMRDTTSGISSALNDGPITLPSAVSLPWAPPSVTWYHSAPSLSTPSTPMLPTWWWPQALMQPEMFSEMSPRS
jgi:hypothetical protein